MIDVAILNEVALLRQALSLVSDLTCTVPIRPPGPDLQEHGVMVHDPNGPRPIQVTLYIHHDHDQLRCADRGTQVWVR